MVIMMNIELATISDCYLLAIFKKKMWESTYRGIYPDEYIDQFNVRDHARKFQKMIFEGKQKLFIVWIDNTVKGYMSYGFIRRPFEDYKYDIGYMYVDDAYQRQGIGTQLFNMAKEQFLASDIHIFIVSCNKYNLGAQEFYKKMGGEIVHIDEDHRNKSRPQVKFLFNI